MKKIEVTVEYGTCHEVMKVDWEEFDTLYNERSIENFKEFAQEHCYDFDYISSIGMYSDNDVSNIDLSIDDEPAYDVIDIDDIDTEDDISEIYQKNDELYIDNLEHNTSFVYIIEFDEDINFELKRLYIGGPQHGVFYYTGEMDDDFYLEDLVGEENDDIIIAECEDICGGAGYVDGIWYNGVQYNID